MGYEIVWINILPPPKWMVSTMTIMTNPLWVNWLPNSDRPCEAKMEFARGRFELLNSCWLIIKKRVKLSVTIQHIGNNDYPSTGNPVLSNTMCIYIIYSYVYIYIFIYSCIYIYIFIFIYIYRERDLHIKPTRINLQIMLTGRQVIAGDPAGLLHRGLCCHGVDPRFHRDDPGLPSGGESAHGVPYTLLRYAE